MDEFRQVGPGKPGYQEDIETLAAVLAFGAHPLFVALAATMSRWGIMLVPRLSWRAYGQDVRGIDYDYVDEANAGPWKVPQALNRYTLVCVVEGHRLGNHVFAVGTWHSAEYVGSKLWGTEYNPVDALVISAFLNRIERQRLRAREDESMENLERWEWETYCAIERRIGSLPTGDRFMEITGCAPEIAAKLSDGTVRI